MMSAPLAFISGMYFSAVSFKPVVVTLPSRLPLSQAMISGGVKPITPTFTGTVTVLPSGVVALRFFVRMTYGSKMGLEAVVLITLASTCGYAGPVHLACADGAARFFTLNW